jgi:hypothetical protein
MDLDLQIQALAAEVVVEHWDAGMQSVVYSRAAEIPS